MLGLVGRMWWVFDLLSHPRMQYAVILAVVAGGLALVRRSFAALVFLALALVNGAAISPLFLSAPSDGNSTGDTDITVVSFNVQIGNPGRSEVIDWVANLDADLVFLWETSQPWRDEFAAAGLPFNQSEPLQVGSKIGGLVLTRDVAQVRLLDTGVRSSIEVKLPFGDGEIVIIGAHPFPPNSAGRARDRDEQLSAVARYAATVDGPVIVAGDLNATPWSSAFRPLGDVLVNSMNGFGWQATYPAGAGLLMLPIDHLLHNEFLTTVTRSVGPDLGSDHLPLTVTLARAAVEDLAAGGDG